MTICAYTYEICWFTSRSASETHVLTKLRCSKIASNGHSLDWGNTWSVPLVESLKACEDCVPVADMQLASPMVESYDFDGARVARLEKVCS